MDKGYYWIRFYEEEEPTVGYYRGRGSYPEVVDPLPWDVMSSDETYTGHEFEVICAIPEPPCTAEPYKRTPSV